MNQVRNSGFTPNDEMADAINSITRRTSKKVKMVLPKSNVSSDKITKEVDGSFTTSVKWDHFLMGSLEVKVQGFGIGEVTPAQPGGTNTWVPIITKDREPSKITLSFRVKLGKGVKVLYTKQGRNIHDISVIEMVTVIPALVVNLRWKDDGRGNTTPDTRFTDQNDIDICFVDETGSKVKIEVSLIYRDGEPFVSVQEVQGGQVVVGFDFEAHKFGISKLHPINLEGKDCFGFVIPMTPENAYPGFEYLETYKQIGPQIIDWAIANGRFLLAQECDEELMVWNPGPMPELDEKMKKNHWSVAAVTWYNQACGFGQCLLPLRDEKGAVQMNEKGEVQFDSANPVFSHMLQMVDREGRKIIKKRFPSVDPMTWVAVRHTIGQKGRQASAIRLRQPDGTFE